MACVTVRVGQCDAFWSALSVWSPFHRSWGAGPRRAEGMTLVATMPRNVLGGKRYGAQHVGLQTPPSHSSLNHSQPSTRGPIPAQLHQTLKLRLQALGFRLTQDNHETVQRHICTLPCLAAAGAHANSNPKALANLCLGHTMRKAQGAPAAARDAPPAPGAVAGCVRRACDCCRVCALG